MIFLFGETIKSSVVKEGSFDCPVCQCQRAYSDILEKGYFTFMFIPTFPISVHAEYRKCHQCKNTYDNQFLEQPAYVSLLQMILSYLINQYGTEQIRSQAIELHLRTTTLDWTRENQSLALKQILDWDDLIQNIKRHKKHTDYESRCKTIVAVIEFITNIEPINYESKIQINMIASHLEVDPLYVTQLVSRFAKNI
jgi:hypothetical protein